MIYYQGLESLNLADNLTIANVATGTTRQRISKVELGMSLNRDLRVFNADNVTDLSYDDFHTYWFMTVDVNLKCVTFVFFVTSMS